MTDNNNDTAETNHTINESHDKIRLETDLTRGTGTRDQEKHKLKARGETPEEAAENLSDALAELEARDVFDRARQVGNDE
jgi:ABC-type transporter Mla subunit MlaD